MKWGIQDPQFHSFRDNYIYEMNNEIANNEIVMTTCELHFIENLRKTMKWGLLNFIENP